MGTEVSRIIKAPLGFKTLKISESPFSKLSKFLMPKDTVIALKLFLSNGNASESPLINSTLFSNSVSLTFFLATYSIPSDKSNPTILEALVFSGGNYDDSRFASVGLEQGGGGAGITPIWLASWSHFMLAEVALASGGAASGYLQDAMQISIDKVMGFGSLDGDADLSTTDDGGTVPTSGTVSDYISAKVTEFSNGDMATKWNILGLQSFVAHFGNGSDS